MTREIVILEDPTVGDAVKSLYDADVIGLPITIHVLLVTVWNNVRPGAFKLPWNIPMEGDPWYDWVMKSSANYEDLWNYAMDIVDEHSFRFGSRFNPPYKHGSSRMLDTLAAVPPLPAVGQTPYPFTFAEMREKYARQIKGHLLTFTNRETPEWLK